MTTKGKLASALILTAGAMTCLMLAAPKSRPITAARSEEVNEADDPFAEMIQEGDGLLARWKAEAAEAAKKKG